MPVAALTSKIYCYHHARLYRRGSGFYAGNLLPRLVPTLQLPGILPTAPAAIQATLASVLQALATGHIEPRRATPVLYALQQRLTVPSADKAGSNLPKQATK